MQIVNVIATHRPPVYTTYV